MKKFDEIPPAQPEAPSERPPEPYDFEYICRCFGLMPLGPRGLAVNISTVIYTSMPDPVLGAVQFILPEGQSAWMSRDEMVALEARLKEREATVAQLRADQIEREARHQIDAQMRAANDVIANANVQNELRKRRPM